MIENISDSGPKMTCDISVRPLIGYTLTNGGWNFGMRFVSGWGFSLAGNNYGAVKFTVPEDGYVKGLWVTNRYSNKDVTAFIFDEFIGNKLDSLIEHKEVHFNESGHYQVLFDDSPYFKAGEEFLGVVLYKNATWSVPFDMLSPITGNSYFYSSSSGNSIFTQWTDKNVVMRAMIRTAQEKPFITLNDTLKHDANTDNIVFKYPYSSSLNYRHVEFYAEESGKIEKLYFYFARRTGKINPDIVILGDNDGQPGGILYSQVIDSTEINTFDEGTGWTEIDLSDYDIHVLRGESFRVGYYDRRVTAGDSLHILADNGSNPTANSWEKTGAGWATLQSSTGTGYNLRIRALISRDVTPVEDENRDIIAVPKEYELLNSYPNPFNNSTTIGYRIKKSGPVTLKIYNILGSEVRMLVSEPMISGAHSIVWDGKNSFGANLSSGVYFVVLRNSNKILSKKILLLR
jgi:hypothetical protein